MADPVALLQQALALVKIVVEHARVAKCNQKHAEWMARRASAFQATLEALDKQTSKQRLTQAQTQQGVQLLVTALEAASKHAREIEERTWYASMYKCKDDQRRFMEVEEDLARAAQQLGIALQVDVRAILEALNDDLHTQFDDMRTRFDEQKQLQAETKESIETNFKDMFKLMSEALAKRGSEHEALEQVIKKHLAGVSVAVRNDPGVQASDLGVRSKEAFVVGVAKYEGQPLANPINDATLVAEALRRCDFRVMEIHNPTYYNFDDSRKEFESRLGPGTLAVFFFSGHGIESDGQNYLLMSDLKPDADERDVRLKYGYPAQYILDGMMARHTAFNLIILDACRTVNVNRSTRAAAIGLGAMKLLDPLTDAGSLIAFATAANAVAFDGDGSVNAKNGLYTKHLLEYMEKPMPIQEMMHKVHISVKNASASKQVPWMLPQFGSEEAMKLQLVDTAPPRAKGVAAPPMKFEPSGISTVRRGKEAIEHWKTMRATVFTVVAARRFHEGGKEYRRKNPRRDSRLSGVDDDDLNTLKLPPIAIRKLENSNLELNADQQLEVLEACIAAGKQQAVRATDKQLVMVIGNTGAGKSTLVNYLHGCQMELHKSTDDKGKKKKVIRVREDSNPPELMVIGHTNKSATFMPKVDGGDDTLTFADCPGFLDNRGAEINIANAVNIKAAVSQAAGIRVLILLNYHSLKADRGRGIRELAQILADLFGDARRMGEHINSALLGLSQANIKDNDGDALQLSDFHDHVSDTTGLGDDAAEIIRALASRMFVYDPLNRGDETWSIRDQILASLRSLPPITEPGDVFRTVLTAEDERALRACVNDMSKRLREGMERREYEIVASTLRQLNALEGIGRSLVTRLLADAREKVVEASTNLKDQAIRSAMTQNFDEAEDSIRELKRASNLFKAGGSATKNIAQRVNSMCEEAAATVSRMKFVEQQQRRMNEQLQVAQDRYDALQRQVQFLEEKAREDRERADAQRAELEKERADNERKRKDMAEAFEAERKQLEERMAESTEAEVRKKMQEELKRLEAERDAQEREAREASEKREKQLREQAEASARQAAEAEKERQSLMSAARKEQEQQAKSRTNANADIHELIRKEYWSGVKACLSAYPGKAREKDGFDNLPLHRAAQYNAPTDVVRMLLDANLEGAREKDRDGSLPLHRAAQYKAPADVVRMLLAAYPDGKKVKNDVGYLPVHYAKECNASKEIIKLLDAPVGTTNTSMRENNTNKYANADIHELIKKEKWGEVRACLSAHPGKAREKDNVILKGLPLHLAAMYKAPADVVRMLLDAYAEGARGKSNYGRLPLHWAAFFGSPADVVRMLVEAYPEGKKVKNSEGKLPVHIAKEKNAPKDVIKLLDVPLGTSWFSSDHALDP